MRCLFRGVLFVFVQNTFLKSFDFIVFFAEAKYRFGVVFQAKKPEVRPPKKAFRFQVHYGHSKGNTPDGEKPKAGNRTLKTEYHSLGQNNETSVTRGPVITKTGWLKCQWCGASPPPDDSPLLGKSRTNMGDLNLLTQLSTCFVLFCDWRIGTHQFSLHTLCF